LLLHATPATIVWRVGLLAFGLVGLAALPASAATGDIDEVAHADTDNLRAGPSDQANVRGTAQKGDQEIERGRDDITIVNQDGTPNLPIHQLGSQ
jgi:hypothetical protein